MKLRTLVFAAVAAAAALALAGCGSPTDGSAWRPPGANGGNGENGDGDDGGDGGDEALVLNLAARFATLSVGETDPAVIFAGVPVQPSGSPGFEIISHAGRNALRVTADQNWNGFDINHNHEGRDNLYFEPGDVIEISGVSVSAGNQIGLGFGQTGVWLNNWQSFAGANFSRAFDPLTEGDINEIVTREGPNVLRMRGSANGGSFVITQLAVRRE